MSGWQFWVDRGGTFTDIVARHPDGRLSTGASGEERGTKNRTRREIEGVEQPVHGIHVMDESRTIGAREAPEDRRSGRETERGLHLGAAPAGGRLDQVRRDIDLVELVKETPATRAYFNRAHKA